MSRKIARELGVKLLYQLDFHKEQLQEQIEIFLKNVQEEMIHDDEPIKYLNDKDIEYIKDVVNGTISDISAIDKIIEERTKGWTLNRIAKVDLAILRLAIYEMFYKKDIPKEIAINEAVELAKKYSSDESRIFVNGILGKIVEE